MQKPASKAPISIQSVWRAIVLNCRALRPEGRTGIVGLWGTSSQVECKEDDGESDRGASGSPHPSGPRTATIEDPDAPSGTAGALFSMARSDLLLNLVKAGSGGDVTSFRRVLEAMVADERAKQHHVLADRLATYLNGNGHAQSNGACSDRSLPFLHEVTPFRTLDDLILPASVRATCDELVEEHHRADLLRSYALEPRHRVLLVGPPGNGKTSLAEALATAVTLPLFVVRYEGIIASYLGETAARVAQLFEYVRTRKCVLFLDEFDTLGKERGDVHDTGEIKRVVSSLLLQVDRLPSYVLLVTATNHAELLDRAAWRRFQLRLHVPQPDVAAREKFLNRFASRFGEPLGLTTRELAEQLDGLSFAELEDFCGDVLRRQVLSHPGGSLPKIVSSRLEQWTRRAFPRDAEVT